MEDFLVRAKTIKQDFTKETDSLKKIGGDWYAIGKLVNFNKCESIVFDGSLLVFHNEMYTFKKEDIAPIDPTTKAIHFEDMTDGEDNPIFASLDSEKGIGGDICKCLDGYDWVAKYNKVNKHFAFCGIEDLDVEDLDDWNTYNITGIQK